MYRWLTLFFLIIPYLTYAARSPYSKEEEEIPKNPNAPPTLTQKTPSEMPHCERYFVYQGEILECDSHLGRDGERLKRIIQDVPSALAELDLYQVNQERVKWTAYLGTLGLLVGIAAFVFGRPAFDSGAPTLGGYFMLGGLGLTANSWIYGLSLQKVNESHLGRAVEYFNVAHPEQPITLEFSTQIHF